MPCLKHRFIIMSDVVQRLCICKGRVFKYCAALQRLYTSVFPSVELNTDYTGSLQKRDERWGWIDDDWIADVLYDFLQSGFRQTCFRHQSRQESSKAFFFIKEMNRFNWQDNNRKDKLLVPYFFSDWRALKTIEKEEDRELILIELIR